MSTKRCNSGFTLLEVLIALTIFAVAGTVSLQAYLSSVRHVQIMTEEKNYVLLSAAKIEELKTAPEQVAEKNSGAFAEPFEEYEWSLELSDFIVEDTASGMTFTPYKLTVRRENRTFSMTVPFLKTEEKETAEGVQ